MTPGEIYITSEACGRAMREGGLVWSSQVDCVSEVDVADIKVS